MGGGVQKGFTLVVSTGNDFVQGNAGNDFLTGGLGDDLFVFSALHGSDTITDFSAGIGTEDRIDISSFGYSITDIDDFLDSIAYDSGNDVILELDNNLGNSDALTLLGVNKNDLMENDFVF